jgi:hypothetical protein
MVRWRRNGFWFAKVLIDNSSAVETLVSEEQVYDQETRRSVDNKCLYVALTRDGRATVCYFKYEFV